MARSIKHNIDKSKKHFTLTDIINKSELNTQTRMFNNDKMSKQQLYHYHIPKYGYCFYNFNNINEINTNGFIIVNLNDYIDNNALRSYLYKKNNVSKTSNHKDGTTISYLAEINNSLMNNKEVFKQINNLSNKYQIVFYLQVYNMLYITINDEANKLRYNVKFNEIYDLLKKYVNKKNQNILISYQFDKFNIRNTYTVKFIDDYIKSKAQYISVNYEQSKFLVGKYYKLDKDNIHRYVNNNFLFCYKNNLKFINSNNITNYFKDYELHSMNDFNDKKYIHNSNVETLAHEFKSVSEYLNKFSENHKYNNEIIDYDEVCNNTNDTMIHNYSNDKNAMHALVTQMKCTLDVELKSCRDDIAEFFKETINNHAAETVLIGMNLDFTYDTTIYKELMVLLNTFKLNNNSKTDKKIENTGNNATIDASTLNLNGSGMMNIINIMAGNVKIPNFIMLTDDMLVDYDINNTNMDSIFSKVIKGKYNVFINTGLTPDKFEQIVKHVSGRMRNTDNIYFDYEINKRLRLSLALNTYYENFVVVNGISKNNKYLTNRNNYTKLREYIKYVNQYTIHDKLITRCCTCCACTHEHIINYYEFKYLPYLSDKQIKSLELDLFI